MFSINPGSPSAINLIISQRLLSFQQGASPWGNAHVWNSARHELEIQQYWAHILKYSYVYIYIIHNNIYIYTLFYSLFLQCFDYRYILFNPSFNHGASAGAENSRCRLRHPPWAGVWTGFPWLSPAKLGGKTTETSETPQWISMKLGEFLWTLGNARVKFDQIRILFLRPVMKTRIDGEKPVSLPYPNLRNMSNGHFRYLNRRYLLIYMRPM